MLIIDSQVHLFAPAEPGETKRGGARLIGSEELVKEMDGVGVARVVIVPPRPDEKATNAYALDTARRWPTRFGVMGKLALDRHESRTEVRAWKNSGLLGYRVSFPPDQALLADNGVDWLWRASQEVGFPVMVWAPRQMPEMKEVAKRFPGARITIDHLSTMTTDRDEEVGDAIKDLLPLAELDNLSVKASGLPLHSSDPFPFANLHGYVYEVVDAFSPQRVFWGSDLTFLPCPYDEAVRMFVEEMKLFSASDLEQIMGLGISRWLRWEETR